MNRRKKRSSPWRIFLLVLLVGGAIYVNQVVVPTTSPLFVPTPTPTRPPESYVQDAQAAFSAGKLAQAIEDYQKAIQNDPKNPSIYIELARVQIWNGQYKDGKASAENALLLNQNNATAKAVRGWANTFLGDYLPAEADIKGAIELDPNNVLAHAYYVELLVDELNAGQSAPGALEKAIEESKTALSLDANSLEAHRARGIILEQTSNYADAIQEFEAAVTLNKNIADLHLSLGNNYRLSDPPQIDKAFEEYLTAATLNPNDPYPDYLISRTYAGNGDYAKAIQYAEVAAQLAPDDPYYWGNLGQMEYRYEKYQDAIPDLRLAVRGGAAPNGVAVNGLPLSNDTRVLEYYSDYGLALAKLNQCGEALQISQSLLENFQDDETTAYNANAIVEICKENIYGTPTPTPESQKPAETPAP